MAKGGLLLAVLAICALNVQVGCELQLWIKHTLCLVPLRLRTEECCRCKDSRKVFSG
jgi:hypothetical protein